MKKMRIERGMFQAFCALSLLLFTCGSLFAQKDEHRIKNIVLVHGAWADGSGWRGVYDILVKDGCNVSMVQEPETTFGDDVPLRSAFFRCKMARAFLWFTATEAR